VETQLIRLVPWSALSMRDSITYMSTQGGWFANDDPSVSQDARWSVADLPAVPCV